MIYYIRAIFNRIFKFFDRLTFYFRCGILFSVIIMKAFLRKLIPVEFRFKVFRIINSIFFAFCRLFPIKNRVFFYTIRADGKLLENSRMVYDALDCEKLIFAKMLPHPQRIQPKLCFNLLTSRVIVTDDYLRYMRSIRLRNGQKLIQIWHAGGAFKCFGLDAPSKLTPEQERATHSQYSAVIVTGEDCKKCFADAFGVSEEICLPLGLPRTDKLLSESGEMKEAFFKRHPELRSKKIYLYCPTFRENDGEKIVFNPGIDWKKLSAELSDDEVFIVKRHPVMDYSLVDAEYGNIFDFSDESTLELASACDVMITDYSSVSHDACLLGKPAVFYCPDYKKYERSFYLKFPDDLSGELVDDGEKLLEAVRRAQKDPPLDRMEKFRKGQVGACDGHSTERVAGLIASWLE